MRIRLGLLCALMLQLHANSDETRPLKTLIKEYHSKIRAPYHQRLSKDALNSYYGEVAQALSGYSNVGDHIYWQGVKISLGVMKSGKKIELLKECLPKLQQEHDRLEANTFLVNNLRGANRDSEANRLFDEVFTEWQERVRTSNMEEGGVETISLFFFASIDTEIRLKHLGESVRKVADLHISIAELCVEQANSATDLKNRNKLYDFAARSSSQAAAAYYQIGDLDSAVEQLKQSMRFASKLDEELAETRKLGLELSLMITENHMHLEDDYSKLIGFVRSHQESPGLVSAVQSTLRYVASGGNFHKMRAVRFLLSVLPHIPSQVEEGQNKHLAELYFQAVTVLDALNEKEKTQQMLKQISQQWPGHRRLKRWEQKYTIP